MEGPYDFFGSNNCHERESKKLCHCDLLQFTTTIDFEFFLESHNLLQFLSQLNICAIVICKLSFSHEPTFERGTC